MKNYDLALLIICASPAIAFAASYWFWNVGIGYISDVYVWLVN